MTKSKLIFIILLNCHLVIAQKYSNEQVVKIFDSLSIVNKQLNNKVQLNVSSLELSELINSISLENNLNVVVEPNLNQLITYNFFDVQVKDVFAYLYQNYEIDIDFVGSIISFKKRTKKEEKSKKVEKLLNVTYNDENKFLSVDLKNDTLSKVFNLVTQKTGINFIISNEVRDKSLNGYFLNRPIEQVLEMICTANNLALKKQENDFIISPIDLETKKTQDPSKQIRKDKIQDENFLLEMDINKKLNILAFNRDILEIISESAKKFEVNYIIYSNIEGKTNININGVSFDELLGIILQGSKYGFRKSENVYLIGESKIEGIRKTEILKIENRTIESVVSTLPKEIISDLEVKEFIELNALIISGTEKKINELISFVKKLDVVVAMVQIDVIILYSKKGSINNTGIKAGIKPTATETSGQVFPELDITMGANSINSILNAINGFGLLNLGQVTEKFYVSLQALESNSFIKIESTPKISTLNGHEASISIGETTYYQETQVNVQTSVTNQGVLQSKIWKSVDANLTVKIKPIVSADEYVTLKITVNQDDFSGKVDPSSPPNISTQTLESLIRVKNGEVILLGGLEKKKNNDSGSGVPWISRVPVLKWFFSSRQKEKDLSKLHILVRPTVTY